MYLIKLWEQHGSVHKWLAPAAPNKTFSESVGEEKNIKCIMYNRIRTKCAVSVLASCGSVIAATLRFKCENKTAQSAVKCTSLGRWDMRAQISVTMPFWRNPDSIALISFETSIQTIHSYHSNIINEIIVRIKLIIVELSIRY